MSSIKNEIINEVNEEYDECLHQGDFIRNVDYLEKFLEVDGQIEVSIINFPLVIVLTQECDATQDYFNRKRVLSKTEEEEVYNNQYLLSIIVAPVYNLEDIKSGNHLEHLELKNRTLSKDDIKRIQSNRESRYHYMKIEVLEGRYIEYVVDFKNYFTVNVETMIKHKNNKDNFQFTLKDLYKDYLSQRFANYLSRIGLPEKEVTIE